MSIPRFRMPRWRAVKLIVLVVLVLGLLYGRFVEPRRVQVTHFDVPIAGLPRSLDGLRVVQLSDLHRKGNVRDRFLTRVVEMAGAERPDVLVLTGDFVSGKAENAWPCAKMCSMLHPRFGTFAVLGNHDHWSGPQTVSKALRSNGITLLMNENRRIAPGLYLIGIDDAWAGHPDVSKAWQGVDESAGKVLLSHTPAAAKFFSTKRCLAITGHMHGGEIDIPPIPRALLPGVMGCKYLKGWYHVGRTDMYVNRGIGIVNPLRIRFNSRPEITVYTLRSKEKGS